MSRTTGERPVSQRNRLYEKLTDYQNRLFRLVREMELRDNQVVDELLQKHFLYFRDFIFSFKKGDLIKESHFREYKHAIKNSCLTLSTIFKLIKLKDAKRIYKILRRITTKAYGVYNFEEVKEMIEW